MKTFKEVIAENPDLKKELWHAYMNYETAMNDSWRNDYADSYEESQQWDDDRLDNHIEMFLLFNSILDDESYRNELEQAISHGEY